MAEGCADGSHSAGSADLARDPAVGAHLAARDLGRLLQHATLEGRQPAQIHAVEAAPPRQVIEDAVGELLRQRFVALGQRAERGGGAAHEPLLSLDTAAIEHEPAAVHYAEGAERRL